MAAGAVGTNAFGLDAELFTRGTGDDQPRGETLVQRHLNQLQAEKEALAMQKLGALMPGFGAPVRALALKEAVQDVDTALSLLRAFQTAHVKELHGLHKVDWFHFGWFHFVGGVGGSLLLTSATACSSIVQAWCLVPKHARTEAAQAAGGRSGGCEGGGGGCCS